MKILFPGTFDPPTIGHEAVIGEAMKICAKEGSLHCAIFTNSGKNCLYSPERRKEMLLRMAADYDNMFVEISAGLLCDYYAAGHFDLLLRGVRNPLDFNYESNMAHVNRLLNDDVITLLVPAAPALTHVSSSVARELIRLGKKEFAPVPLSIKDLL